MQKQLGREPNWEVCPPDEYDFPQSVTIAVTIFHQLGNRVYPDIGYMGKDYTNLPIYFDMYDVDNIELTMEVLSRLDARLIKKSQEKIKREHQKAQRKPSGKK